MPKTNTCFRCKTNQRYKDRSYCVECLAIINHYHNHKFKPVKEILATKSNEIFINSKEDLKRLEAWRDTCEKSFNSKGFTHYLRVQFFKEYVSINRFLKTQ